MNAVEAREWLDAHVNLETGVGTPSGRDRRASAPTLERIRSLTELLGTPQAELAAIHLTGTNGKTSAARLTSALLVAAGLDVGTFTSPHLEDVRERIDRSGAPIDEESLAAVLTEVAAVEDFVADRPSYFEVLTAAALAWFAEVAVDVAVLEVGLGGTWDATNIVDAEVAAITNVSIDHVEYLGRTRAEIAREKAGIIKPASRLVLGETDPEITEIFLAREPSSSWIRDEDFGVRENRLAHGGRMLDLFTPGAEYEDVFLSLHGAHQADNVAIALACAQSFLGRPLDPSLVREVLGVARSPGRLEVVGHEPLVLLDGAHNEAGARALAEALAEAFPAGDRTYVVGLLREKDPLEMLAAIGVTDAAHLLVCRPPSPRALAPEAVAEAARELGVDADRIDVVDDVAEAVATAVTRSGPGGQVVVTGSLYVVGAARDLIH